MTNPTNPFNWQMPTASDLVTDLPADFETFGQAVATSMADLLGGTTGQVLSKASNTDMDFTWVTSDDANAIQNTIVDAKGDLIAASAADTPARLAVGNNGETLVADSSTATGLRYQSGYNGNAIINGGMDIWQRGTSIASTAANLYTADRWCLGAGTTGRTVSRQSSGITGIQYAMRVQRDSGNTSTLATYLAYNLESADSYRFAGKTVTISFWARAGANFSPTSGTVSLILASSTGTDQNILNVWAGNSGIVNPSPVFTTSWQRFTYTGTVNSNATQLAFYFISSWIGTAGANDWFELTGVQLEVGSVATEFKRSNGSGGTIQGELAACQRYYYRLDSKVNYSPFAFGVANSTGVAAFLWRLPVTMRTSPTSVDYSTLSVQDSVSYNVAPTSITVTYYNTDTLFLSATGLTGATQFRPYFLLANNSTAAYLAASAEL